MRVQVSRPIFKAYSLSVRLLEILTILVLITTLVKLFSNRVAPHLWLLLESE